MSKCPNCGKELSDIPESWKDSVFCSIECINEYESILEQETELYEIETSVLQYLASIGVKYENR